MTVIETSIPKKAVPFLLKLSEDFVSGKAFHEVATLPTIEGFSDMDLQTFLHRLDNLGVVEIAGRFPHAGITVHSKIVEVANSLRNLPPPNYWADFTTWFTSRKWTLPVVALVVGTPVIYCWVEIAKSIMAWIK